MTFHRTIKRGAIECSWSWCIAVLLVAVFTSGAQDADYEVLIGVYGQNSLGVEEMKIIFDADAKAPSDADPDGDDELDLVSFNELNVLVHPNMDFLHFQSGSKELFEDARPLLAAGDVQQFRMEIRFGTVPYNVVSAGIAYYDEDNNFGYTDGEYVWFDSNNNGKYDDGTDTRLNNNDNNDTAWVNLDNVVGSTVTIFFSDSNDNSQYDVGEAVWTDPGTGPTPFLFEDDFDSQISNPSGLAAPTEGDPGSSAHTILLAWDEADAAAAADIAGAGGLAKIIVDDETSPSGMREINMRSTDGSDDERRVLVLEESMVLAENVNDRLLNVVFVFGAGNVPADVKGIEARVLSGADLTIDPFEDPNTITDVDRGDGEQPSLVKLTAAGGDAFPGGGSVDTILGGSVTFSADGSAFEYTAPDDKFSVPSDVSTWDSFTYTVRDGAATDEKESTGVVRILVLSDKVVAARDHTDRAKAGSSDSDSGLTVTVTITLDDGVIDSLITLDSLITPDPLTKLQLLEGFPTRDGGSLIDIDDGWQLFVKDGAKDPDDPLRYELGGANPPDQIDNDTDHAVFGWSQAAIDALPADTTELSFTYRIVGHSLDRADKSISGGVVVYKVAEPNSTEFDLVDTPFTAVEKLFHAADYTGAQNGGGDWKISFTELFRVVELYNNNKNYAVADSQTQDGFMPVDQNDTGTSSGYHTADYDNDWKISFTELFRVVELYNNNKNYAPADTETQDGYMPSDAAP